MSAGNPDALVWRCECGSMPWRHYEHCPECGRAKPEPVAEAPKHEGVKEPDAA